MESSHESKRYQQTAADPTNFEALKHLSKSLNLGRQTAPANPDTGAGFVTSADSDEVFR
jgi:hypothetical protein